MWFSRSRITSSPGFVCAHTATRLPIVPLGTNSAACLPSSAATCASSALTVGSSPQTSSPTSASAIALRIPASGTVKVSLRRSIGLPSLVIADQGTPPRSVVDEAHPVAPRALGAVQRVVGEAQQLARVAGVVGEGHAADADGDAH